ncbi:MAG: ATP-binding cassette domain-containing protein [Pirellulales bacterium]
MSTASSSNTTERIPTARPLLDVRGLTVHFPVNRGWFGRRSGTVRAVDGVDFVLRPGETLGLVGESGCGKSTLSRAVMGLVPLTAGEVFLDGRRIDRLDSHAFRAARRRMQMVFQDPFASLNPRMTVAEIVREPLDVFGLYPTRERPLHVMRLLETVGLNPRFINRYPHEFSGGQRQRIGIARALAVEPKVLILDEPVSALDVSIQAQIINLLAELRERLGLAYVFIAHDLSVVRHLADRTAVMYLGKIVETGPTAELFAAPRHPYTKALLSAIPLPDPQAERARRRIPLLGDIPSADTFYTGCRFADRCPLADAECVRTQPPYELRDVAGGTHLTACFKAGEPIPSLQVAAS